MLPALCTHPAVLAYLDAADQATNSSSLLLPLPADAHPTAIYLQQWLRSAHFVQVWLAADRQRGWYNYHTIQDHLAADWPRHTDLLSVASPVQLSPMPLALVHQQLLHLLTVPTESNFFSPYGTALPVAAAQPLCTALWAALSPTTAYAIAPHFLHTLQQVDTGLATDYYFGGTPNDTATYLDTPHGAFLLLTNGIP